VTPDAIGMISKRENRKARDRLGGDFGQIDEVAVLTNLFFDYFFLRHKVKLLPKQAGFLL